MDTATRLHPLPEARARQLRELMREVQHDECRALALDSEGRVQGIVGADDTEVEHLLGDLDVHA